MWFIVACFSLSALAETPKVHLNHFYTTLAEDDYRAIQTSDFLKNSFAVSESRTTVRKDTTYTAFYLYGMNTYLEFFNASDTSDHVPNGIGFGVDHVDEAKALNENLTPATVTRGIQDKKGHEKQIPWFQSYHDPALPNSKVLDSWLMEYFPGFLREWHSELKTPLGVARRDILMRYKAWIADSTGQDTGDRLFGDVTELIFEVAQKEIDNFVKWASTIGWVVERKPDRTVLHATQAVIILRPGAANKLVSAKVDLQNPASARQIRFGKHVWLELNGSKTAIWHF